MSFDIFTKHHTCDLCIFKHFVHYVTKLLLQPDKMHKNFSRCDFILEKYHNPCYNK